MLVSVRAYGRTKRTDERLVSDTVTYAVPSTERLLSAKRFSRLPPKSVARQEALWQDTLREGSVRALCQGREYNSSGPTCHLKEAVRARSSIVQPALKRSVRQSVHECSGRLPEGEGSRGRVLALPRRTRPRGRLVAHAALRRGVAFASIHHPLLLLSLLVRHYERAAIGRDKLHFDLAVFSVRRTVGRCVGQTVLMP